MTAVGMEKEESSDKCFKEINGGSYFSGKFRTVSQDALGYSNGKQTWEKLMQYKELIVSRVLKPWGRVAPGWVK